MLQQVVANVRGWMQGHTLNTETVLLGLLVAGLVVAVLFKFLKPPKT